MATARPVATSMAILSPGIRAAAKRRSSGCTTEDRRLPEAVRTASLWLNRIRRGFNEIKQEVKQELHNDSVMQELRKTGQQLKSDTDAIGNDLKNSTASLAPPQPSQNHSVEQATDTAEKNAE